MDLSISIVSWNTRDVLDACLKSVFETTRDIEFEVIVVDNASLDGSAEMVEDKYPEARVIRNTENVGFSRANNRALEISSGRYFMLLNSDTICSDGALTELVRFMGSVPSAGAAGPVLVNPDGSLQPSWARLPSFFSEAMGIHDRRVSDFDPSLLDVNQISSLKPFEVGWVGGACLIARRRAVETVGPLDERFFMYCEETEWCYRFHAAGYKVFVVPQARITHLGGASSRNVPIRSILRLEISRLRLLWRTGPANRLSSVPFVLISLLRVVRAAAFARGAGRRE